VKDPTPGKFLLFDCRDDFSAREAAVDYDWKVELLGEIKLSAENVLLDLGRRVVVVKIEANFSDSNDPFCLSKLAYCVRTVIGELFCPVGVNTSSHGEAAVFCYQPPGDLHAG
jgi:hypothetical protein